MEPRTKIILIAVISSTILAGFIAGMVVLFSKTDPNIEYVPQPREENAGSNLIWYNNGNEDDIKHWTDSLDEFIKPYEGRGGYSDNEVDYKDCSERNPAYPGEVCIFNYQALGMHCSTYESWGYNRKSPCVILKLKQIPGWVPDVYNQTDLEQGLLPEDMPQDLKNLIHRTAADYGGKPPHNVWVSCNGHNVWDQEHLGEIEYTPWQGFPAYYFPYTETPGYLSPIVALRLVEPASSVLINIQCHLWAKNIPLSHEDKSWTLNFAVLLD